METEESSEESEAAPVTFADEDQLDIVLPGRRFFLVDTGDRLQIWDRWHLDQPIESFAATDDGDEFEVAIRRMKVLRQKGRREDEYWFRISFRVFLGAVAAIPLTFYLSYILQWAPFELANVAYQSLVASFLACVLLWLRANRSQPRIRLARVGGGIRWLPRFLSVMTIAGLLAWVGGKVLFELLPREEPDPYSLSSMGGYVEPEGARFVASVISGLGFVLWVACLASLILLALLRSFRDDEDEGEDQDEEPVEPELSG